MSLLSLRCLFLADSVFFLRYILSRTGVTPALVCLTSVS